MADEPTTPTNVEDDSAKGDTSTSSAMGNESDAPVEGTTMTVTENVDSDNSARDDALTVDDVTAGDPVESADAEAHDDGPKGPSFADLNLSDEIVKAVKKVGFETPSPIQAATIPILAEGHTLLV